MNLDFVQPKTISEPTGSFPQNFISIGVVFIGIVNFSLIGSAVSEKGAGSGICLAQNHLRTTGKLPTKFHLNRCSIYRYITILNFSSIGSAVLEKGDGSRICLAQNHLRTTGKLPTKFHLNRSSIYRYISIVNFSSIGSAVSEKGHGSFNFLA